MSEEEHGHDDSSVTTVWYRHQMLFFISGSIVIALLLVLVSMALYASSGAAQLDLSRPGYKSVQDLVKDSDSFVSFPSSGPVDSKTVDEFLELYDKQVKPVDSVEVFSPSALGGQALGIDAPTDVVDQ